MQAPERRGGTGGDQVDRHDTDPLTEGRACPKKKKGLRKCRGQGPKLTRAKYRSFPETCLPAARGRRGFQGVEKLDANGAPVLRAQGKLPRGSTGGKTTVFRKQVA